MTERSWNRVRWGSRIGALVLVAGLALSGCGIAVKDSPTLIGDGPMSADQDTGAGFGDRFREPDGPDDVHEARDLVKAYFTAAAGGGAMADRVRAFLTGKARDDWKAENDEQPTVVRLESVSSAVPTKDGGYDVQVTWSPIGTLTANGTIDAPQARTPQHKTFHVVEVENAGSPGHFRLDGEVLRGLYLSDEALRNPGWYRTNPIYFWDKSHSVLVPDVRYLPLSIAPNQRPTTIVNYLLAGPSSTVAKAVASLPEKAKLVGNVVSEEDGGLVVGLTPGSVSDDQEDANLLVAQLRASLAGQKVTLEVDKVRRTATGPEDAYRAYRAALQGTRVAFGVGSAEDTKGKVVVLGGIEPTPLVIGPKSLANRNVVSAAINRELNQAAFVREIKGKRQLWLATSDAQSGQVTQRQVPLPAINTISRPAWVYGTDYALVAVNGNLYTVRQAGQPVLTTPTTPVDLAGKVTQVSTSPEGRRVAIVAGGRLYVSTVDANGSVNINSSEIGQLSLDQVQDVGWTAEDRLVVFGLAGQNVRAYRVSSDGASATPVPNLEDATLTGLAEIAAYPGDTWEEFTVSARTANGVFEVNRTGTVLRVKEQVSLEFFPG